MTATRQDIETIHRIAERAARLYARLGYLDNDKDIEFAICGIAHEILTVHSEIVPLRLAEFLAAEDFDFAHDVGGIHRHLDDGRCGVSPSLKDCFLSSICDAVNQQRDGVS